METIRNQPSLPPDLLPMLAALLAGSIRTLAIHTDGRCKSDAHLRGAILSGSFNPLHAGHLGLVAAAAAITGLPPLFELPVVNADKGTLPKDEVLRRASQFAGQHTLLLSRVPLFSEKAALFPGSAFVVGYDTAVRLLAPRYYGGEGAMLAALGQVRAAGCRFLVAGRVAEGRFLTLADIALPPAVADLFSPIPESHFRMDISSTELRARGRV
ncbi:MAG: hypothetical protein MUD01_26260 [Chloroflexaceae bacterium]|jgi:hypothetical protein|nr:hypothetical protein [Chloroflexaceae bacterium]